MSSSPAFFSACTIITRAIPNPINVPAPFIMAPSFAFRTYDIPTNPAISTPSIARLAIIPSFVIDPIFCRATVISSRATLKPMRLMVDVPASFISTPNFFSATDIPTSTPPNATSAFTITPKAMAHIISLSDGILDIINNAAANTRIPLDNVNKASAFTFF